jgi:hypothetical protein
MARVLAVVALVACSHKTEATGAHYRIDSPPQITCTAAATCEAKLVVNALGDYHLNDRYPFKFEADAQPGIAIESATFSHDAATAGTMTIRFRANTPGTAKLAGTLRLCVCTDDNCDVESPKIAVDVSTV